jgi:hypothetical protein
MQDVVDWAQIVGAAGAVIAIGFAIAAQRDATRARKAVSRERRRQFELEILRDLAEWVDNGNLAGIADRTSRIRLVRRRISLVKDTLPYWAEVVDLTPDAARATAGMEDQISAAQAALSEHNRTRLPSGNQDAWIAEGRRLDLAAQKLENQARGAVRDRLLADLERAVECHVDAVDD